MIQLHGKNSSPLHHARNLLPEEPQHHVTIFIIVCFTFGCSYPNCDKFVSVTVCVCVCVCWGHLTGGLAGRLFFAFFFFAALGARATRGRARSPHAPRVTIRCDLHI